MTNHLVHPNDKYSPTNPSPSTLHSRKRTLQSGPDTPQAAAGWQQQLHTPLYPTVTTLNQPARLIEQSLVGKSPSKQHQSRTEMKAGTALSLELHTSRVMPSH
jgi:hypothetical protein